MLVKRICWNRVYTAQPTLSGMQRGAFRHIMSKGGYLSEVSSWWLWGTLLTLIIVPYTNKALFKRTGFHGESGLAGFGGHLTVNFSLAQQKAHYNAPCLFCIGNGFGLEGFSGMDAQRKRSSYAGVSYPGCVDWPRVTPCSFALAFTSSYSPPVVYTSWHLPTKYTPPLRASSMSSQSSPTLSNRPHAHFVFLFNPYYIGNQTSIHIAGYFVNEYDDSIISNRWAHSQASW